MENNSQPDSNTFSVRIVSIDYYMSPPIPDLDICYSIFQGGKVNEVPVIRIYGSTPAGQKTCLHVHRALPYLYVPCSVPMQSSQQGDKYTRDMANAIEKALKVKIKSSSGSKRQHVHGCTLVRAKKFYGYYKSEELFVKIYLYYPHEVARVAALLLDGAILGRSYQPHESHIPYLLQFLVEYNLYGMGHLHVSKVKFRYPLPDGFIPRGAQQSGMHRLATGKVVSTSFNDQADSGSCLGMPIWTSSTVQTGWIWPHPAETDGSPDQELCLIKRQSICELEGDATVDDILNQQFKMYSPLSQTRSDVKMVQSLVPMWQEECERTGMHEEVIHSDPNKPLPENVMKTLSHGPEFEDAVLYICSEAEQSSSSQGPPSEDAERFLQSIRSLVDVGSLREFSEHANPNGSNRDSFQRSEEVNRSGSTSSCSLSKQDDDAESSELRHKVLETVPAGEAFKMIRSSDPKGIDTEALGLLRWLASSQAAEDLNTDDELRYDMILTPLLPKTAIGKILDKANLDYECESQQECQDILDSVLDTNSYLLKEQAVHSTPGNHLPHMPVDNIIPQVDGSSDDLVTGSVGTSKKDIDSQMGRSSSRVIQGTDIGCSIGKKKRGRLWGPLPFSTQQKVSDTSESSSFYSTDVSNGMKDCTIFSSSGKKDDECCEDSVIDANANDRGLEKQKKVTESSTRDLMRRKRYRRVDPSEGGTFRVTNISIGMEQEKTSLSPKRLEFHMKNDDIKDMPVNPLFTDQAATACEKSLCFPTSVSGEMANIYGFRPAYSDTSLYGKLPLMSSGDCSLQGSTPKKEHFISHKLLDDVEPFGDVSRTENIIVTDVCVLDSAKKEVPKSLNSPKKDTATSTGQPERSIVQKESELFLRCSTPFDTNGQDACYAVNWIPAMCSDSYRNTIAATNANIPQSENFAIEQKIQACSSSPSLSSATPSERMCAEYIEMSFSKKPPLNDWKNWTSEDTAVAPVVHDQNFVVDMGDCEGILAEGGVADDVFPFFSDNVRDVEEVNDRNNQVIKSSGEAVIGIPTHFQNDGSLLYLLTTVYSPPSVDSISEWLLRHPPKRVATGTSRKNISSKVLESPSPGGSNRLDFSKENNSVNDRKTASESPKLQSVLADDPDMIYSQEHLVNRFQEFSDKSGYVPHMDDSSVQLIQKENRNPIKENNLSEVLTERYNEGTLMKGNEHIDSCQDISQISGPDMRSKLTPLSQTGFRDPASVGAGQQLTLMSIEVQAESRGDLRPDPRIDAVTVIAVRIQDDNDLGLETFVLLRGNKGESFQRNLDAISGCSVIVVLEEKHLFYHFVKIVRSSDPDILMGWEIQGGSLGFLAERAAHLGILLLSNISRTPSCETEARNSATEEIRVQDDLLPEALVTDPTVFGNTIIEDEWGRTHASGVHVGGRIVLNIWRLMRGEVKLNMYTMEAVAEEALRRKVPLIPPRILAQWFSSGPGRARFRCIEYIIERAKLNLEIMDQLDMINRTSELARVFGIDFFSVLSRGSQYRVESMFLRLAHTQNYLAISPGNQQVPSQPAMECLPLVMEPESRFYADPVVVLDFQSLYPSMIIAYNLCFCTCLGKVIPAKEDTLGVCSYIPDPQHLMNIKNRILLTPNGVMYVPSEVRKGVLPRLLEEILSTRIMVKRAMKSLTPSERVLYRIFNARQLGLKLISNVTYGYTAAGFSGRMPCAELADSIVQCGRRTLENAISYVNSHDKWKARVIYGDTDSMFVLLKGRTMKESFSIGQEIASVITSMNPAPVTLKMEKVYHPCFLLTKKRYVGYSYETPDQVEPFFDAKGIETVRRDSCGAVAKTMEQSLRLFFESQDISKVKAYLRRQWTRILAGRVSLHDFVFAKEVRLGTYSNRSSSLPPAAIVAIKAMKTDPRAEPRYAERVPYVVIHGEPGARLVDMVVDPLDLLATDSPFSLNDSYYINKQIIPALQRVFGLVGADLKRWFSEMPRPVRSAVGKRFSYAPSGQRTRIDSYYLSRHCLLCGELVQASNHFCDKCYKNEAAVATAMVGRTSKLEREVQHLAAICRHCGGGDWIVESGIKCVSLACTVFYDRRKVQKELQALSGVAADIGFYPRCMVELF